MFKESAGDKILRGGKKRGRDPEDGCEGSEGAGREKKSPPGAVTERETEREREQRKEGL